MARSRYEIRAQKELEDEGYEVDYKPRPRFTFRNVDFFNRFDLLAYREGELRCISVKGHAGVPTKHIAAIHGFKPPSGVKKETWQFVRKHWIKKEIA